MPFGNAVRRAATRWRESISWDNAVSAFRLVFRAISAASSSSVWVFAEIFAKATLIVEMLEDRVNCLNGNLIQQRTTVETLHTQMGWNAESNNGLRDDIHDLQDKVKQTQLETKIEDLQASLHLMERRLAMAEDEIEWLTSKAPTGKPKARVSKPTSDFIPDTPATTPHAASKKPDATKPKTPLHKPTPAVEAGTH